MYFEGLFIVFAKIAKKYLPSKYKTIIFQIISKFSILKHKSINYQHITKLNRNKSCPIMKTQQAIDDYLTQNRRYVLLIKLLYLYI